ncbi:MAG: prepilin-type N-terminal cleavage/methylation domain-containing protein [Planctomycetota bacterium]
MRRCTGSTYVSRHGLLRSREHARGFTLLELLLVMSLIAVLMGVGIGVLARIDVGDRVGRSIVTDAVRSAHNWAVGRQAPARVVIDPVSRVVRAEGQRVIGTWHFESLPVEGAFGIDGVDAGVQLADDGFQGRALSFERAAGGAHVEIPVQHDPSFDLARGFALRVALRPSAASRGGAVLRIGETIGLETSEGGGLSAWFAGQAKTEQGDVERGGRTFVRSPHGALTAARWSLVDVRYDLRALVLSIDGIVVARTRDESPVWRLQGPLVISPDRTPWPGSVDSLVISAVAESEEMLLPQSVSFAPDSALEIVFASGGGLDRERHAELPRITLVDSEGATWSLLVHWLGTVE